ncbi:MAG: inositol monophosphatase [Chloroflexi bacterium]|nr:inositol monophosphatase [Chloroflexota bacterium]MCL5275001.1 inositol monophosphatase [Chloroflexota bacterium]
MSNNTEKGKARAQTETASITDILSAAITIARGAGAILREGVAAIERNRGTALQFKSSAIDPVTEYDVRAEKYIVGELNRLFPEHRVVGEEGGAYEAARSRTTASTYQWHVDPLDGTVNFAHGFSIFCVSLGLLIDGAPSVGVVYSPVIDEMFAAARGHGATRNGVPIHVSVTQELNHALLVTGFPYDSHTHDSNIPEFLGFQRTAQATRRIGSAALDMCYVAAGQMDGYWESKIKPHDIAAGIVLVREAGGIVTDYGGGDSMLASGIIVASNGLLHGPMLDVLKKSQS